MNRKITEEVSSKIQRLKKRGKNMAEIARSLGVKYQTIYSFLHPKEKDNKKRSSLSDVVISRKKKEEEEEDAPLFDKRNNCSMKGEHRGKMVWVTKSLLLSRSPWDALLIIGNQNTDELKFMVENDLKKKVFGFDKRKDALSSFINKENCLLSDVLQKGFSNIVLKGIKAMFPKTAVFFNLTGRVETIQQIHSLGFSPIVAVVSPRFGGKGKISKNGQEHISSLEMCKKMGATIYPLKREGKGGHVSIAVFDGK